MEKADGSRLVIDAFASSKCGSKNDKNVQVVQVIADSSKSLEMRESNMDGAHPFLWVEERLTNRSLYGARG